MRRTIIACALVALIVGATTATAASLITSGNIKDGTIQNRDIHKNSISLNRMSRGVQSLLKKVQSGQVGGASTTVVGVPGSQGAKGDAGAQGAKGDAGAQGPAGANGANGTNGGLPQGFFVTNTSVGLTASGVEFGPYADGGAAGGSVLYTGLNGKKLSDIKALTYTAEYSTDNHTDVGVPYLRVFLNEDQHDVIFSPNTQATKDTSEDQLHKYSVTEGSVRYDDDAGNAADSPWADVVAAHGDETISGIYVSTGFSAGQNLTAFLRAFSVNDQSFTFGA